MDAQQFLTIIQDHEQWLQSLSPLQPALRGQQLVARDETWTGLEIHNHNLTSAEITNCHLKRCVFAHCAFDAVVMIGTIFEDCTFVHSSFTKADLRAVQGAGSVFRDCNFTRADFTDADFRQANLQDSVLEWAWLSATDLRYANLEGIHLAHARLSGTKLYSERRFRIVGWQDARVDKIYIRADGEGSPQSGVEALAFLVNETG